MREGDEIEIKGEPRKPIRVGTVITVDMETGEVVGVRQNAGVLLPAPPGTCPECACHHEHDRPHNRESVFYQIRFQATHGRLPTWTDAMAHCPPGVRAAWGDSLVKVMQSKGLLIPDDLADPKPGAR